jgi:hypothetical protein
MTTTACAMRSSATNALWTPPPRSLEEEDAVTICGRDDEIWVAIATQAADGRVVDERLRDVLFRLVFDAADAEVWEPRADSTSGELAWFEVARLGLLELT